MGESARTADDFEQLALQLAALSPVCARADYAAGKQAAWAKTMMARLGGKKRPTVAWSRQYDRLHEAKRRKERKAVAAKNEQAIEQWQQLHQQPLAPPPPRRSNGGSAGLCGARRTKSGTGSAGAAGASGREQPLQLLVRLRRPQELGFGMKLAADGVVLAVAKGSVAATTGIKKGFRLLQVDGLRLQELGGAAAGRSCRAVQRLAEAPPGAYVELVFRRYPKKMTQHVMV